MELFEINPNVDWAEIHEELDNWKNEHGLPQNVFTPRLIVEGTDYNLPSVEELVSEWNDTIMESDCDWDIASEPDLDEMQEDNGWDADPEMISEHLAVRAQKMDVKLERFTKDLRKAGLDIPKILSNGKDNPNRMRPQRKNQILFQRVVWQMSDGQTISAVFEILGGDGSSKKIMPDHTLVTFQWKVNSKDITRHLYPDQKTKLSQVNLAKRLATYVAANASSFASRQSENKQLDSELDKWNTEHDEAEKQYTDESPERDSLEQEIRDLEAEVASLEAQIKALKERLSAEGKKPAGRNGDSSVVDPDTGDDEYDPTESDEYKRSTDVAQYMDSTVVNDFILQIMIPAMNLGTRAEAESRLRNHMYTEYDQYGALPSPVGNGRMPLFRFLQLNNVDVSFDAQQIDPILGGKGRFVLNSADFSAAWVDGKMVEAENDLMRGWLDVDQDLRAQYDNRFSFEAGFRAHLGSLITQDSTNTGQNGADFFREWMSDLGFTFDADLGRWVSSTSSENDTEMADDTDEVPVEGDEDGGQVDVETEPQDEEETTIDDDEDEEEPEPEDESSGVDLESTVSALVAMSDYDAFLNEMERIFSDAELASQVTPEQTERVMARYRELSNEQG